MLSRSLFRESADVAGLSTNTYKRGVYTISVTHDEPFLFAVICDWVILFAVNCDPYMCCDV